MGSFARAERVSGMVSGVDGEKVEILVVSPDKVSEGAPIELFEQKDGGRGQSIGLWSVKSVEGNRVTAAPFMTSGKPKTGMIALIGKPEAKNIARRAKDVVKSATTRKPSPKKGLSARDAEIMGDLNSGDPNRLLRAAKLLNRRAYDDPALVDRAAEILKEQYNQKPNDRHHVDVMAWLCKALVVSHDQKYAELLAEVARDAKSKKLRAYAQKYGRAL